MLKFEIPCADAPVKAHLSGAPGALADEMAVLIECFTYNLFASASFSQDDWNKIGAVLATGFSLAVRNGLNRARKEREDDS